MADKGKKKKRNTGEGFIDLFKEDSDSLKEKPVPDIFAEEDEEPSSFRAPEKDEEPEEEYEDEEYGEEETPAKEESGASREKIAFDRYGRRVGGVPKKRRKDQYGKRKNAKKAGTTVAVNDTEAVREQEEARHRAYQRDKLREKHRLSEQETRKKQRQIERQKQLSVLAVLAGLLVLVLAAGYFTFLVQGVDFVGSCTRYTEAELLQISGLKVKRHILTQNLNKAEENLEADPYISATVKYVFPNRIQITVSERTRVGAVLWGPNKEYVAVVDSLGIVLESDSDETAGLPKINGLVVTGAVVGQRIGDQADEQVQSMLDVLNGLSEYGILTKIASLDVTETMGISMYTAEGYRIEVGAVSGLATKLSRLKNNWTAIMDKAAGYASKGADNVTIYLYSKNGVVISPHEIDYVEATATPSGTLIAPSTEGPLSTPNPGDTAAPSTDVPSVTPTPYNGDPFTG